MQYDLFQEVNEITELKRELDLLKISQDRVRRRLFANNDKLKKMLIATQQDLDCIKKHIK